MQCLQFIHHIGSVFRRVARLQCRRGIVHYTVKEECEEKAMTGKNLLVEGERTHTHNIFGNARGSRVTQDAFRLCKYRAPVALHNEDAQKLFFLNYIFIFLTVSQLNDSPCT